MTKLRLPGSGYRLSGGQIVVPHGLSCPVSSRCAAGDLVLCKPEGLCYTLPAREPLFRLFLGSSAVEHSTVNRMVAGSNPARGANDLNSLPHLTTAPLQASCRHCVCKPVAQRRGDHGLCGYRRGDHYRPLCRDAAGVAALVPGRGGALAGSPPIHAGMSATGLLPALAQPVSQVAPRVGLAGRSS
jgi:hypothetical protein